IAIAPFALFLQGNDDFTERGVENLDPVFAGFIFVHTEARVRSNKGGMTVLHWEGKSEILFNQETSMTNCSGARCSFHLGTDQGVLMPLSIYGDHIVVSLS